MTNFIDLSKDLAEEILCRVPATELKRVRSTCTHWNSVFTNATFARKHLEKAEKEFLALVLTTDNMLCPISMDFHGEDTTAEVKHELQVYDPDDTHPYQLDGPRARIRGYISYIFEIARVLNCEGLLLCTGLDESRIVVWNPCTSQTKWISPIIHEESRTFVLGYYKDNIYGRKSYKILSYDSDSKNSSEIYEFSSHSWRTLDHDIAPGWSLSHFDHCVSLKGDTYVFGTTETPTHINLSLLRFDFSTEKFVAVPLPCNWPSYVGTSVSVVREEKLSVLLQRHDDSLTEIYVTNKIDETKVVSWSKILVLDLSGYNIQASHYTTFLLDEEKKLVVLCQTKTFEENLVTKDMVYLIEGNTMTPLVLGINTTDTDPVILNFVPSLVQLPSCVQTERVAGNKRIRGG